MTVNLSSVGGQLGKTGNISLTESNLVGSGQSGTHGFDRVYTTAASHYKRVNPFEVTRSFAPHPTGSAPYPLSDWDGYAQWNFSEAASTQLDLTVITEDPVFQISWSRAPGYELDAPSLRQFLFYQTCSLACMCQEDCATVSLLTYSDKFDVGDVSASAVGVSFDQYYIATIVTHWNERGKILGASPDSEETVADLSGLKTSLTLGTANDAGNAIYFYTGTTTTTTTTTTVACHLVGETCTGGSQMCDTQGSCCEGLICCDVTCQ